MQKFDHNIGFKKNANFFTENCPKSQKIVVITSTPSFGCTFGDQSDQIGRIFDFKAIACFGLFFPKERKFSGYFFPRQKLCINFAKYGVGHKLIWSP
jgi:hypothetical protein